MSRFQYLPKPLLHPGKCIICGSPEKSVIDFNLDIRFYGRIYFCHECVAELARVIGFVPATELRMVYPPIDKIREAEAQLKAGLEDASITLTDLFSNISSDLHSSLASVEISEPATRGSDESSSGEPETQSSDDGQDVGSVSNEGSDGVSSSTSNESDSVFGFK